MNGLFVNGGGWYWCIKVRTSRVGADTCAATEGYWDDRPPSVWDMGTPSGGFEIRFSFVLFLTFVFVGLGS
ncbi:hypothetical protein PISMIDRAFT_671547 [Pisolithus microcarpus 441]|uniref:Uncharacterized protein n=1 Tax=Pisolithus microcarpus 441 TaxID=765257 RepID=A0A0C9ZWC9_9AGAM|nr:hypothetical protein PISMIDRAFT_671547 [Pisolithus microcarpus 441]